MLGVIDNDMLQGGSGNDELEGGEGADSLVGDSGNDTILGENGNDTIVGGTGADSMIGGNGNDSISANFYNGPDGDAGDRIWGRFVGQNKDMGDTYTDSGQGDFEDGNPV